jgi:hypothetical protein
VALILPTPFAVLQFVPVRRIEVIINGVVPVPIPIQWHTPRQPTAEHAALDPLKPPTEQTAAQLRIVSRIEVIINTGMPIPVPPEHSEIIEVNTRREIRDGLLCLVHGILQSTTARCMSEDEDDR